MHTHVYTHTPARARAYVHTYAHACVHITTHTNLLCARTHVCVRLEKRYGALMSSILTTPMLSVNVRLRRTAHAELPWYFHYT